MKKEKTIGKKTLLAWVKEIFSQNEAELTDIPSPPPEETVEKLIDRGAAKASPDIAGQEEDAARPGKATPGPTENEKGNKSPAESCAYAVKRNIVKSLQEIRIFAEKNNLAAAIVRALLTLLAEMAIGALKGKVGEKALDTLLKAFNYQRHIEEAYIRGRNEKIIREYFPEADDIPHLGGMQREDPDTDSIFYVARQA